MRRAACLLVGLLLQQATTEPFFRVLHAAPSFPNIEVKVVQTDGNQRFSSVIFHSLTFDHKTWLGTWHDPVDASGVTLL